MNNDTKPWYQSRTLWFNVAAVLLGFFEAQTQALKGLLPAVIYPWLVLLLPLGNILLRTITNAALTVGPQPAAPKEPTP